MAISIACVSIDLSRHDERKPRFRKLQLHGVDRGCDHLVALRHRRLTRRKAGGDRLQRPPCGELCLPSPVCESSCTVRGCRVRGDPFSAQALEARVVDRFERKLRLESLFGSGIQGAGVANCPVAIEPSAVALEAERSGASGGAALSDRLVQAGPAARAKGFRASALQLPS
jgi:hypothetical protein